MNEHETDVPEGESSDSELQYLYRTENLPLFEIVEDLRWKILVDRDGERIGTIETVENDEDTGRVEFLQIGRGGFLGFGAERFLVPVTRIVEVNAKTVTIVYAAASLEGVPIFEHDRLGEAAYSEEVRSWWLQFESQQAPSVPVTSESPTVAIEPGGTVPSATLATGS